MSNEESNYDVGDEFTVLQSHADYGEVDTYVVDEKNYLDEYEEYGYRLEAKNGDRRIGILRDSEIDWMIYDGQLEEA